MMTGRSGSAATSASSRSSPLPSGRRRSSSATSTGVVAAILRPSAMPVACWTSKPCRTNAFDRLRASTSSSSTMSSVGIRPAPPSAPAGTLAGPRTGTKGGARTADPSPASILRAGEARRGPERGGGADCEQGPADPHPGPLPHPPPFAEMLTGEGTATLTLRGVSAARGRTRWCAACSLGTRVGNHRASVPLR